jgi:hypothetical protein
VTAFAYGQPSATITRRGLLAAGGAAVVGLALTDAARLTSLAGGLRDVRVPAYLRASSFVPLVGDRFELTAANGWAAVRLVAVNGLGGARAPVGLAGSPAPSAPPVADDAFALTFHASGGARLEQDVMTLRHTQLGAFQLLVSPSGTGRHGQDYAAIINRARPPRRSGGTRVRALPR